MEYDGCRAGYTTQIP